MHDSRNDQHWPLWRMREKRAEDARLLRPANRDFFLPAGYMRPDMKGFCTKQDHGLRQLKGLPWDKREAIPEVGRANRTSGKSCDRGGICVPGFARAFSLTACYVSCLLRRTGGDSELVAVMVMIVVE